MFESNNNPRFKQEDVIRFDSGNEVQILDRESGERMDSFGRAGAQCGGFHWIRNIAIRLQGKVCAAEFKGV